MSTEVSTQVTPALHPDNVKHLDGYNDETAKVLGMTETAFSTAYNGIVNVANAREKAKTNPTWNEAQQIIHTQELADKVMDAIARSFDSTRANLMKGINFLDGELNMPLTEAAAGAFGKEIRDHVKGLNTGERQTFIQKHIDAGDERVVSAILGAPPFLSGLDANMQSTLTRVWHMKKQPDKAARLKVMQGAKELIETRAGLVFKELEKAVGMRPDKVRLLRQAKTEAEKAFLLKDA